MQKTGIYLVGKLSMMLNRQKFALKLPDMGNISIPQKHSKLKPLLHSIPPSSPIPQCAKESGRIVSFERSPTKVSLLGDEFDGFGCKLMFAKKVTRLYQWKVRAVIRVGEIFSEWPPTLGWENAPTRWLTKWFNWDLPEKKRKEKTEKSKRLVLVSKHCRTRWKWCSIKKLAIFG